MSIANTTIILKKSGATGNVPSSLNYGETALNYADGKLYYKNALGSISYITNSQSFATINANSSLILAGSPTDILTIVPGNNISISACTINKTITINSTATGGGGSSTLTTNYKVQEYVATSGQTVFTVTGGYQKDYISVYVNGVLLDTSDYVATNGSTVTLNVPASIGDNVSVAKWYFDSEIYLTSIQKYDQFTANSGQVVFTTSSNYTEGYIKVFRNGILLENSEYTATNGANVSLTHSASANDIIVLHYWGGESINATPVYIIANTASETANLALSGVSGKMTGLDYGNLTSISVATTSNTANQVLDTFSTSSYRSAKYLVQVTSGSTYQVSEITLIHDGTNPYSMEYGLISTSGSSIMEYDSIISSGNVVLRMSPVNATNTIKLIRTSVFV